MGLYHQFLIFISMSLLIACGAGSPNPTPPTPPSLRIAGAGQSNMNGQAPESGLSTNYGPNFRNLQTPQGGSLLELAWECYNPAGTLIDSRGWGDVESRPSNQFGPEITSTVNAADIGQAIAFAKYSQGGTGAEEWLTGARYGLSVTYFLAQFAAASVPGAADGLIGMWGESDALTLAAADAFGTNIETLVAQYRTDLGVPALPFAIWEVPYDASPPFVAELRASLDVYKATNPANVRFFNIDDIVNWSTGDDLHVNASAMQIAGSRALQALYQAM